MVSRHGHAGIFRRAGGRLTANQLLIVADRRFDDALYLCDSRQNKHANGAMYLGGYVVELLLKAQLLRKHAWLASRATLPLTNDQRRIHALMFRFHNLEAIVEYLPELMDDLQSNSITARVAASLRRICAEWTVYARYSTAQASHNEAREFLARIREVRTWLRK